MYDDKIKIALANKVLEMVTWMYGIADKNVYWEDVEVYNDNSYIKKPNGSDSQYTLKIDVAKYAETKEYYKKNPRRTQFILCGDFYFTADNKVYLSKDLIYDNGNFVNKNGFPKSLCQALIQLVLGWEETYKREIKKMVCLDNELLSKINSVVVDGASRHNPKRRVIIND